MYLYVSNTMYQVATHLLATSKMNATRVDEGLLHSTASFTMKYCCDRHWLAAWPLHHIITVGRKYNESTHVLMTRILELELFHVAYYFEVKEGWPSIVYIPEVHWPLVFRTLRNQNNVNLGVINHCVSSVSAQQYVRVIGSCRARAAGLFALSLMTRTPTNVQQ